MSHTESKTPEDLFMAFSDCRACNGTGKNTLGTQCRICRLRADKITAELGEAQNEILALRSLLATRDKAYEGVRASEAQASAKARDLERDLANLRRTDSIDVRELRMELAEREHDLENELADARCLIAAAHELNLRLAEKLKAKEAEASDYAKKWTAADNALNGRVVPTLPPVGTTLSTTIEDETVLEEASRVVDGPRRATYGHPKVNHGRTAIMWSAYLSGKLLGGIVLDARDVCHLNSLQKLSREANSYHRDNLTDLAGYARNAEIVMSPGDPP